MLDIEDIRRITKNLTRCCVVTFMCQQSIRRFSAGITLETYLHFREREVGND